MGRYERNPQEAIAELLTFLVQVMLKTLTYFICKIDMFSTSLALHIKYASTFRFRVKFEVRKLCLGKALEDAQSVLNASWSGSLRRIFNLPV